jgi:hypothetical protein
MFRSPVLAAAALGILPGYVLIQQERQLLYFGVVAVVAAIVLARRRELTAWVRTAAATSSWRRRSGPMEIPREPQAVLEPARSDRDDSTLETMVLS